MRSTISTRLSKSRLKESGITRAWGLEQDLRKPSPAFQGTSTLYRPFRPERKANNAAFVLWETALSGEFGLHQGRYLGHVGAACQLGFQHGHDLAHVLHRFGAGGGNRGGHLLSLIHISEPTRRT